MPHSEKQDSCVLKLLQSCLRPYGLTQSKWDEIRHGNRYVWGQACFWRVRYDPFKVSKERSLSAHFKKLDLLHMPTGCSTHKPNFAWWYGMVYQGLTSHSTQYRSFRRRGGGLSISNSVIEGQRHNNPLNPRCFCLQRPKRDGTSS